LTGASSPPWSGRRDATIIAAIIALGQALEMRIVAEGVETPEQRDLLTELGCDTGRATCSAAP
jgi:EAL domain-containing protein (putative c-di-GMP-specific phosphodiesterase class I)